MQIDLGTLSAEHLSCELAPALAGAPARTVKVATARELVGALRMDEQAWALSGLGCARLLLDALSWTFGEVSLQSDPPAELLGLAGEIASAAQGVQLRLSLRELRTPRLSLGIGALRLSAQIAARALTLEVGERVGVLRAQSAVFSRFELRSGALRVAAPELTVSELTVDWGGKVFRLEAGTAEANALQVEQAGASLRAERIAIAALRAHGGELSIGQVRIGRVELELPAEPAGSAERTAAPSRAARDTASESNAKGLPQIDLRLFDGLAGRLSADVVVDVGVPVIGHRRATHELRVDVEGGAIEYRELEHGLARLEDAFLDFSLRDGALVLERGLPLIATRGRGKPILVWDLDPRDFELAQRGRVRLAVLPSFRVASRSHGEPPSEESGGGAFRLRELALRDIDFLLALETPVIVGAPLRELAFAELAIQGEVCHRADEPECAGALRVTARSLRAQLMALPFGPRSLSGRLEIASLEWADISFAGMKPRGVRAVLQDVAVADPVLSSRPSNSPPAEAEE